jgi:hypothetical protein
MAQTPGSVKVLGFLSILGGIFSVLWGVVAMGIGGAGFLVGLLSFAGDVRQWGGSAFGGGFLGILTGIAQVVVGGGLMLGQRWAWLVALVVSVIAAIGPLMGLLQGHFSGIFGLVLPGLILYLLTRPDVRAAFGR